MTEYSKVPSFKETGLASVITEFALSLSAFRDDKWYPSGTAIVIAPYLAITAKHVVEDYWKQYENSKIEAETGKTVNVSGTFYIVASQILDEGKAGALWNVTKFWNSPYTDISFLRLTPWLGQTVQYKWRSVKINLLPPKVGTRVAGFGYHSPHINLKPTDRKIEVQWKDSPTTTIGEVIEIYGERRDQGMLTFPCYQINAKTRGGMSGGPIFNEEGKLCGIICSGMEEKQGETDYISYVASLWPSMGTEIDMDRQGFPKGIRYPVLELAKYGFIKAENWEKISLLKNENGTPQVQLGI